MEKKLLHKINMTIFLIIILFDILSIFNYGIKIKKKFKSKGNGKKFFLNIYFLKIILDLINILMVIFLGWYSLKFSNIFKLLLYLIFSSIINVIYLIYLYLIIVKEDYLNINFILLIFQIFFILINIILVYIERKKILKERSLEPLNNIDENITEEKYNDILNWSKNPI
jgi:hypothetical protein